MTPGEIAYNAYCESFKWKYYDGLPIPQWKQVGPEIQKAWDLAARKLLIVYYPDKNKKDHEI
jgi:curved DNA-binding protein CbpA